MGVLRRVAGVAGWTAFGAALAHTVSTRRCKVVPIEKDDYIFGNTLIARFNPNSTPVYHDVCVRKVPVDRIKPELLGPQNEGKLVQTFCAGLWSGGGYAMQRRILSMTNRNPKTEDQLWDKPDLESNSYDVGTMVTDHFQVVSKTPESIILRAGDSPLNNEVREADGLFELLAEPKEEEGVVEFQLKSVFFNGLAASSITDPPFKAGGVIAWLHQQYCKVLMESAIRNCTK